MKFMLKFPTKCEIHTKLNGPGIAGNILSILIGAAMVFAFAPYHLYPLAIILPALLLCLWSNLTPNQAFLRGWLFGMGMFSTSIYWVYISINTFGDAPAVLAALITSGLIAILAIFPALTGYFLNRFFILNTYSRAAYAFPSIWVLLEWIRSWIFTGFPWLTLGYSQTNSPLRGFAPIISVLGISFLTLFTAALFTQIYAQLRNKDYRNSLSYLVTIAFIWGGGVYLSDKNWTTPFEKPVKVSLVQGNIAQQVKWSADNILPTLTTYRDLTIPHWDSDIIIWPESSIPLALPAANSVIASLTTAAQRHHATLLTGIPVQVPGTQTYFNALIALGDGNGFYIKHRLVPFGEYTPLNQWLNKFLDILHLPMSDFVPATKPAEPILAKHLKLSAYICYEIAFPELGILHNSTINMLVTISNDAWFGESIAQAQHLQMAQMRSLELRRPLLFVSNNGLTAVINSQGQIQSIAPPYQTYVLTDTVQPTQGKTPWQQLGLDPVLFGILMLIALSIHKQRIARRNCSLEQKHKQKQLK